MRSVQSLLLVALLLAIFICTAASTTSLSLPEFASKINFKKPKIQKLINRLVDEFLFEQEESQSDSLEWPESRCTNVEAALNVRNAPSPSGSVVKTLGPETEVTVYDVSFASDGTKWAKIGNNQWVSAKFLKMACENSNSNSNSESSDDKAAVTLARIFGSEGKCQNWASDSGNEFQGKIGYTCMGVIPSECWNNRNTIFSPLVSGFSGHPADFCKYAYDRNTQVYKQCAAQLYEQNYFGPGGCAPLPMPAFYVCSDIAVNSGVGRSRQYISELGGYNGQDAKEFAHALNEKHRADYKRWGCSTCKNRVFLAGWLARADERENFINSY